MVQQLYFEASLGCISSKEFWKRVVGMYPDIGPRCLDTQLELDFDILSVTEQLKIYTRVILLNDAGEW